MKKITVFFFLVLANILPSGTLLAQAATDAAATAPESHHMMLLNTLYIIAGIIILAALVIMARLVTIMSEIMRIQYQKANGTYVEPAPKEDFADKILRSLDKAINDAVPVTEEASIDLGHDYDGIRELDNNLPPWWTAMFYATIAFSIFFLYYFHMGGGGTTDIEDYEAEVAAAQISKQAYLAKQADNVDESTVVAMSDAASLQTGKTTYITYCASCHGQNGEGNVGPNLTDDYWLHGGGIQNVFKTVKYGVPAKGMIAWESQLTPAKIQQVSSYILTLHGSNPANAKAPQGDVWKEEVKPTGTDSTATQVSDSSAAAKK
ncbi:MAG: cbb3-type cytochrome c oxidase N-terminal domain-containing protein [Chitinophagales bacterium]|nr:cbb3-type cytochrome c oxidase N-terminal domain-containing protein [Chitinophagales bacterium]